MYKGLAGLFYIEDENSRKLSIPKEYGVNDIPLVIQDKKFTDNGNIPYDLDMRDMMNSTSHPFHIHAVQFRIIERNGKTPPLNERGWKDTVMVDNGEEVRILVRFRKKDCLCTIVIY